MMLFVCAILAVAAAQGPNADRFSPADVSQLKAYRLTAATVAKAHAATRTIAATPATNPAHKRLVDIMTELERPVSAGPTSLAALEASVRSAPIMMSALAKEGLQPREFVTAVIVIVQAYLESEMQKAGGAEFGKAVSGIFGEVAPANVKFVADQNRAITALLDTIQNFTN